MPESFGIPQIQAAFSELAGVQGKNILDFSHVIQGIHSALQPVFPANRQDIGKVVGKLNNSLGQKRKANQRDMSHVKDALQIALAVATDHSNVDYSSVAAAIASSRPPQVIKPTPGTNAPLPIPFAAPVKPNVAAAINAPVAPVPPAPVNPVAAVPDQNLIDAFGNLPGQVQCDYAKTYLKQGGWDAGGGQFYYGAPGALLGVWKYDSVQDVLCRVPDSPPGMPDTTGNLPPWVANLDNFLFILGNCAQDTCPLPGPPPPPPPPPIIQAQWYCFQSQLDATWLTAQSPDEIPGYTLMGGPYATQEEALNNCPTPAPPPPPPTPSPICDLRKLPDPPQWPGFTYLGTDDNCAKLDELTRQVADIGVKIFSWIVDNIAPEKSAWPTLPVPQECGVTDIYGCIKKWSTELYNIIACLDQQMIELIRDALQYLKVANGMIFPQGYDWAVGIWVVKTVIRVLEDLRIGLEWGAVVELDIHIEFESFKELLDYLSNYVVQMHIPEIADAIEGYLKGTVTEDQAKCWIQLHGGNWDNYYKVIRSRRERLRVKPLIQYARRNDWQPAQIVFEMNQMGYTDQEDILRELTLYDELPTVADHLHWLTRNVFDTEYVQKYQLEEGFDDRFWKAFGHDLYAQGYTYERAKHEYAAHWIMPSPTQMQQFVYRLRPGRDPNGVTFTVDDYKRILAEQDYNIRARTWFAATVNPVPAISYIKQMFRVGAIDADQLKAYHMDLGYTDVDSDNFVAVDK